MYWYFDDIFVLQQPLQIPQMGFSDHSIHNVSLVPETYLSSRAKDEKDSSEAEISNESTRLSDQEVLEEVEAIYFAENVNIDEYELKVCLNANLHNWILC